MQETFTGKFGTINKNGTPHIVPIWYALDKEDNIIFNTGNNSIKAKIFDGNNRVCLCVDDQVQLYSFVTIDGIEKIISKEPEEVFRWAKIIAARYMGNYKAEEHGKRNSLKGERLIKIKPMRVIGEKHIARW